MMVEWPKHWVDRLFNSCFDEFTTRVRHAQKIMIFRKYMKVSSATNKTVSSEEFKRIMYNASSSH